MPRRSAQLMSPLILVRLWAVRFSASLTVSNVVELGGPLVFVTVDDAAAACYEHADAPMTATGGCHGDRRGVDLPRAGRDG